MKKSHQLKLVHKLIAYVLLISLFLQSCENSLNQLTSQEKEQEIKEEGKEKEEETDYSLKFPYEIKIRNVDYVITSEEIGRGGYGTVFKGYRKEDEDKKDKEFFAFKYLDSIEDDEDKVLDDIMNITKTGHPNIVKYYGCGMLQGKKCLALEWIKGETISNKVMKEKDLFGQYKAVKAFLKDSIKTLDNFFVLHENGTGKNVILTQDIEGKYIIKLIDFGTRETRIKPLKAPFPRTYFRFMHGCIVEGNLKKLCTIINMYINNRGKHPDDKNAKTIANPQELAKKELKIAFEEVLNDEDKTPKELFESMEDNGTKGEILKILIKYGIIENERGLTPLHFAALHGYRKMAEYLVEQGADVNAKNRYGDTPLFTAAGEGNLEVAKLLIEKGADINTQNNNDLTPIQIARARNYTELVDFLNKSETYRWLSFLLSIRGKA